MTNLSTVFCCGIPYEGKGSCIVCGTQLGKIRAREKQKLTRKNVSSIVDELEKERQYRKKLWWESFKFAIEQAKRANPNKLVVCKCCGEKKPFRIFQWITGERPQYDIMSDEFDEKLFEAYGPFINYKDLVCGNCAANYGKNLLPKSTIDSIEAKLDAKKRWWRKRHPPIQPPTSGVCPKCLQIRSLHPNAWVRTGCDAIPYICRRCRIAANQQQS